MVKPSHSKKKSFLWGASTSAHQVEGGNIYNDWWQWEKKTFGAKRSGQACDHYNRYKDDFDLAKNLGHNAHRLSLEWSRIEPKEGYFSRKELDHYKDVLSELRRRGLESFVTLHHFTSPAWLADRGGWTDKKTPKLFARYTEKVVSELGELVDFWVTINEPIVYATQSFGEGNWPPQEKNLFKMWLVIRRMAKAHRLAYRTIHRGFPRAQVGIAKHLVAYLPENIGSASDNYLAPLENWWFNHYFFSLTANTHDFIGANYYFAARKRLKLFPPSIKEVLWSQDIVKTDMGWPIFPAGLTHVLLEMKRYGKPVYITENGLADADDSRRPDFIRSHLRAVEEAQAQGVDVRGYLHWSLLDNFEWAKGYKPRFGLVEVDFQTMERIPRKSAYVYKAIIEQAGKHQT